MPYLPVLINAVDEPVNQTPRGCPFRYAGNLFALVNAGLGPIFLQVWKSTDGGTTWTHLDAAHEPGGAQPPFGSTFSVFDGAHTLTAQLVTLSGSTMTPYFQDFDLSAETWGPVYGSVGAPAVDGTGIVGLYRRSDGTLVSLALGLGVVPFPTMVAYVFSGTWAAPIDFGVNIAALPGFPGYGTAFFCEAVLDALDTLHVFCGVDVNTPGWNSRLFYQQILSSGALGNFFDFPGQGDASNLNVTDFTGQPCIVGGSLVKPCLRLIPGGAVADYTSVYVGSPLTAPVWAAVDPPGINPTSYNVYEPSASGQAVTDGTTAYVVFIETVDPTFTYQSNRVTASQSVNLSSWTAAALFDYLTDPVPPGFLIPAIPGNLLGSLAGNWGSLLFTFEAFAASFNSVTFFLMPPGGSPPSAACNNPPGGLLLQPYLHTFLGAGGTPPYTFSISAGALPPGVTLNGATGIAAGAPTAYGVFPFTLQVTDSAALSGTVDCSITVQAYVASVEVILRGVKRYRASTPCDEMKEIPTPPHVRKAV